MTLQPVESGAPANHPAWIFSHLNVYLPIIASIIQGKPFEDPKGHPFGMQSKPESDASIYASKDELVAAFVKGHEEVSRLLSETGDAALHREIELERWKPVMPTSAFALPYLMMNHENIHLGQLSAWRRIQGMPSV